MEKTPSRDYTIWWFAFGYFAAYAPYTLLTKTLTKGILIPGKVANGFAVLPISVLASLVGMFIFLGVMRWFRFATHKTVLGVSIPVPTLWTGLSGLCTATIIMTTTLAYTFKGVSIVFIMLLMRGGVLVIAPIADFVAKRPVKWFSWAGLGLSLAALFVAERGGKYEMTLVCGINVLAYLAGYFVRLRFMSRLAKSDDEHANTRYFVEEQMVGTPALLVALATVALVGKGQIGHQLRIGFTDYWSSSFLWPVIIIGILSQGTGIFGGLILLDKRENTFCVPVNRTSSILAGVLSSFTIAVVFKQPYPGRAELMGAGLVVGAILMLTIPPLIEKARRRRAARAQ